MKRAWNRPWRKRLRLVWLDLQMQCSKCVVAWGFSFESLWMIKPSGSDKILSKQNAAGSFGVWQFIATLREEMKKVRILRILDGFWIHTRHDCRNLCHRLCPFALVAFVTWLMDLRGRDMWFQLCAKSGTKTSAEQGQPRTTKDNTPNPTNLSGGGTVRCYFLRTSTAPAFSQLWGQKGGNPSAGGLLRPSIDSSQLQPL